MIDRFIFPSIYESKDWLQISLPSNLYHPEDWESLALRAISDTLESVMIKAKWYENRLTQHHPSIKTSCSSFTWQSIHDRKSLTQSHDSTLKQSHETMQVSSICLPKIQEITKIWASLKKLKARVNVRTRGFSDIFEKEIMQINTLINALTTICQKRIRETPNFSKPLLNL